MPDSEISKFPDYTNDLSRVIEAEQTYIAKHRAVNGITEEESREGTWGICFSSGGIGSSIMTLGFMQALMKKNFFRRIDYMSSVSAGGFMATCLTSLLTGEKSNHGKFGVDSHNSPFISDLPPAPTGKSPTANQQLEHLKRYRGFLPGVASKTSMRNILGVWFGGWAYGFAAFIVMLFFAVSGHSYFLYWFSNEAFFEFLSNHFQQSGPSFSLDQLSNWASGFWAALNEVQLALLDKSNRPKLIMLIGAGVLYALIFLFFLMLRVRPNDHDSFIAKRVNRFELYGYVWIYFIILLTALVQKLNLFASLPPSDTEDYWVVFGYAAAIAAGLFGALYPLQFVHYLSARKSSNYEEIKKAFHGMHGAGLIVVIVSLILPVIYLLSTLIGGWETLIFAILLFILGLFFNYRKAKVARQPEARSAWVYHYLSNLAAILLVILFFSTLSKWVFKLFVNPPFDIVSERMIYISFAVSAIFILLFILFSRADRSNLHYFFKDKISTAFLFTEARSRGGHLVNLRNDALLAMHEIGDDNFSGPYHIINASVNVHKSEEAVRRQRKGLPFIFSKFYVGSEATHYVQTSVYKDGKTKLTDAQTNSTAFLNSGMGIYSFAAQSFLLNALNLRLGAWVENPLYYRYSKPDSEFNYSFPNYIKSAMGRFDERSRYVNISEGDHSGDNFGLIPLIQRRCDHIIICDFTVVHDFFLFKDLFAQTDALAKSYGVSRIELDRSIFEKPDTGQAGLSLAESCVQLGTIYYVSGETSYLYYVKSVLDEALPDNLIEYASSKPGFPYDIWPKVEFGESDFEAYRTLGVHMGKTFLTRVREDLLSHLNSFIDERIRIIEKEIQDVKKAGEDLAEQKKGLDLYLETLTSSIRAGKLPAKQELEGLEKTEISIIEKLNYLRPQLVNMAEGSAKFVLKKEIEDIEKELVELRTKKNELLDLLANGDKDIREKQLMIQKIETVKELTSKMIQILDKQKQEESKVISAKTFLSEKQKYLDTYISHKLSNLYSPLPEFKNDLSAIKSEIEQHLSVPDEAFSESIKTEIDRIRQQLNDLS
ncbi:MAG: patatin-like phospholipase family protein [Bacteroidota bacterium]